MNVVAFEPSGTTRASAPALYVVTASSSTRIPDLALVGLATTPGAMYEASVYALAPFATLDSAVTSTGFGAMATALGLGRGPLVPGQLGFSGSTAFVAQ